MMDQWNASRQRAARIYNELLEDAKGITTPYVAEESSHAYHLYVVQHSQRDRLTGYLRQQGVVTGLHYPTPVHLQPCYRPLGLRSGALPVTEAISTRVISLPIFAEITEEQIEYVCDHIKKFCGSEEARGRPIYLSQVYHTRLHPSKLQTYYDASR